MEGSCAQPIGPQSSRPLQWASRHQLLVTRLFWDLWMSETWKLKWAPNQETIQTLFPKVLLSLYLLQSITSSFHLGLVAAAVSAYGLNKIRLH